MQAITSPLKAKHRNSNRPKMGDHAILHRPFDPPGGTLIYKAGKNHSKAGGNAGVASKKVSLRPRRRAYGPF